MQSVLDEVDYTVDNGLPPTIEIEEEMSLLNPTLTERMVKVEAAIQEILGLLKKKKHRDWIPITGLLVGILAVAVTYFTWWQPNHQKIEDQLLAEQVNTSVEAKLKDHRFDEMVENVNELKGRIGEISQFQKILIARLLKQDASLALPQFKENLNTLVMALDAAKFQNISLDRNTVAGIQNKLRNTPESVPDYWPAVASLVTYRSAANPQSIGGVLPNCWDNYKGHWEDFTRHTPTEIPVDDQTFGHCTLTLDDGPLFRESGFGKQYEKNLSEGPNILRLNLHDGVVVYSGGVLIPFKILNCVNCTFRINAAQIPPPRGQRVVNKLLMADLKKVTLPGDGLSGE